MNEFYAILYERALNSAYNAPVPLPVSYKITPVRYSATAVGGPDDAELQVEANGEELWNALNWLGCGVVIYGQFGEPVWGGYVNEIAVKVGRRARGKSLDNVFNRVKATYTTVDVEGVPARGDTDWMEDADSISRFGIREKRYNLGECEPELANSICAEILRRVARPIAKRRRAMGGDDFASMICKGFWSTLKNRYFARADGKDEHLVSGDSAQMLNWGITSTWLSFANNTITYGPPVTGATNATPIVITANGHGRSDGDIVTIRDVAGNTAANGEFKVASATTNTFALTNVATGANIAGSGSYTSGGIVMATGIAGPFAELSEGELLVVSGSTANNGTLTTSGSAGSNGHTIGVTSATNEAPGATTTITNYAQQVAQSFAPSSNWNAVEVAIRLKKVGAPAFDVVVELRSNNAGVPSATVLASCTIARADVGTTMQWEKVALSATVAVTTETTYWVVVRTNAGSTDSDDGFVVALDGALGYGNGVLKILTNSSAWAERPMSADMPFRVLDKVDTAAQIRAIFVQAGVVFTDYDVAVSSGIESNQYRAGENTAMDEVEKLLEAGASSSLRLIPSVTPDRVVHLSLQASSTGNEIYDRDGVLYHPNGSPVTLGFLPVAQWVRELGVPQNLDFMVDTAAQFVEGAEFDCRSGELNWWGENDDQPYELPGILQG